MDDLIIWFDNTDIKWQKIQFFHQKLHKKLPNSSKSSSLKPVTFPLPSRPENNTFSLTSRHLQRPHLPLDYLSYELFPELLNFYVPIPISTWELWDMLDNQRSSVSRCKCPQTSISWITSNSILPAIFLLDDTSTTRSRIWTNITFEYPNYISYCALLNGNFTDDGLRLSKEHSTSQEERYLSFYKGLISDGFFKYSRNPNYLGETMIYSSFVLCSGHSLGFLIFYGLGGFLFTLNMYIKEEMSYKKKEGWEEYKKQSYILLPKILSTDILNFVLYLSLMIGIIYFLAS